MLVTFTLEKKNCKRAWKYPLETLPTTVCIDFSFEISDALGQSTICSPRFCSFEIHRQIHTSLFVGLHNLFDSNIRIGCLDFILSCCSLFFFTFFSISGCWDLVQGSPWSIDYRSTQQNYNGHHKVRLPPKVS